MTNQPRGFTQADAEGHGTLTAWHDGCRCPWCASKARERGCLCSPCVALRAHSPYVEIPQDPPNPDRRRGAPDKPAAPVRTTRRKELK
ncbi:MAG TPA: hypothetical protein VHY21_08200 [Pseudonocardiaceae bacterium]|nr:hypothetical protein [Pseudonocardiaceae bacterium]